MTRIGVKKMARLNRYKGYNVAIRFADGRLITGVLNCVFFDEDEGFCIRVDGNDTWVGQWASLSFNDGTIVNI